MRRIDRELTKEDIIFILKEEGVCRLAINDKPFPYIVPLNYGLEINGDDIFMYFHCANEGKKLELLRNDGNVAFEIDRNTSLVVDEEKGSCSMLYESLIGNGVVEFLDGQEKIRALRLILAHHGRGEDFPLIDSLVSRTVCFKVKVNELTGKKH